METIRKNDKFLLTALFEGSHDLYVATPNYRWLCLPGIAVRSNRVMARPFAQTLRIAIMTGMGIIAALLALDIALH
jgi:hypothetical protein